MQKYARSKQLVRISSRGKRKITNFVPSGSKYDEESGQVYTETIIAVQKHSDINWTRQESIDLTYNPIVVGTKATKGPRSLRDISVQCVVENVADIAPEGIACLPSQLIQHMWNVINQSRNKMSFDTWLLFSKVLRQDQEATVRLFNYHQSIKSPASPLDVYLKPMTSTSFDFLTSLSIMVSFPLFDITRISSMKNLGVLEIINPAFHREVPELSETTDVTDRLIRTWHEAVLNEDAFPVLRIMKLWGHPELTERSLAYLNSFPALAVYDVSGCAVEIWRTKLAAICPNWKATVDPVVLTLLEDGCAKRTKILRKSRGITDTTRANYAPILEHEKKVRRIPRSEVLDLLARPEPEMPQAALLQRKLQHARQQENMIDFARHYSTRDKHTYQSDELTFNEICRTFSRIGELRNDTDLSRAGIDTKQQVLVDDELVNSVPMASLRLGPSLARPRFAALAFIRIKIQPEHSDSSPAASSKQACKSGPTLETLKSSAQTTTTKPKGDRVMKGKKRKIDDVLDSFH